MPTSPATLLVLFGATGDLANRMLLPSLCALDAGQLLPADLRILCTSRSDMDDAGFRAAMRERLAAAERETGADSLALQRFLGRLHYQPASVDDDASMSLLCERIAALRNGDILYHLSTSPRLYESICNALGDHGLAGAGTRLMLEKPIGHDLSSAEAINAGVTAVFDESQVFRVDHYLGKEGVQNLLALRFGNALFEPLWNARHIEQVQITVAETVGLEGRADYYDGSGALRDMVQNHLLQLLCLTAMEPPGQFEPTAVRNEKLKVLQALRPITAQDVAHDTAPGQYSAGAIDGKAVPGYLDELGRPSDTETFVALRARIDNWRWSGVPFYLRTGKRLPARQTEIYLQFRDIPHSIFSGSGAVAEPNAPLIRLQPEERIEMHLMSKTPGLDRHGVRLSPVALDLDFHEEFASLRRRSAYERLYLDALEDNGTLFVRRDEVETAWRWIDGIHAAWRETGMRPKAYPAGTWGPASAISLVDRNGHAWRE